MNARHYIAIALSMLLATQTAQADDLPLNLMPMTQVLQKLQAAGYNVVKTIEYDDDRYKATAVNAMGEEVNLEIAPVTGDIVKPKAEDAISVSVFDAAQKVEAAGYKNIYYMHVDKTKYEIKAYNSENKKVTLDVDAKTGAIKD